MTKVLRFAASSFPKSSHHNDELLQAVPTSCCMLNQGQARGIWTYHLKKAQYHAGPLFLRPHCGQTSEYKMKDMFIIFQIILHSLILTEWFGHSALPK